MLQTVEYESDTLLSPFLLEYLEQAKSEALACSRESDKMCVIFDNLRFDIICWFNAHLVKEKD